MERELILEINMKSTGHPQAPVGDSFADVSLTLHHAVPVNTFETRCETRTREVPDFIDVTDEIAEAIVTSGVHHGRAIVFTADEACSIMVNERESGLLADLKKTLERLEATNGNGPSKMLGSSSVVLPIEQGRLLLGKWQRVLLVELSEPAARSVNIQIVGEKT